MNLTHFSGSGRLRLMDMSTSETPGDLLRRHREAAGLSQAVVAEKMVMTQSALQRREADITPIRVAELPRFAAVLACRVEDLVPGARRLTKEEEALLEITAKQTRAEQRMLLRLAEAL